MGKISIIISTIPQTKLSNSAFKVHNTLENKMFKPKIIINPFVNKDVQENCSSLSHSSHSSNSDCFNKNKIFCIEKIRKNEGSCLEGGERGIYYEKKGKNPIRIKRKEKYRMFNAKFKEECIKMVSFGYQLNN